MNHLFTIIIIAISLIAMNGYAQKTEIGFFAGGSFYMGDLNPSIPFLQTQPAGGLAFRYTISKYSTVKVTAIYGSLKGDDAVSKANVTRNLSFSSSIMEFSPQFEINFFPYLSGERDYNMSNYIFGGISVFKFQPQSPVGAGFEGVDYSLFSVGIPFGIGIKINMTKEIIFSAEWGMRKTFTDFIDDVSTVYPENLDEDGNAIGLSGSQRGNSYTKDWYSFAGIIITYRIRGKEPPCSAYDKPKNYLEIVKPNR